MSVQTYRVAAPPGTSVATTQSATSPMRGYPHLRHDPRREHLGAAGGRPGVSPLHFAQRFTGTFSDDANTITAAWERSGAGRNWRTDFTLTYTRFPATDGAAAAGHERTTAP